MIIQLDQVLPLDTPFGPSDAHFLIDYGTEHPIMFVVFVRSSGECWVFFQK